ncbi:MAG: toxin-antitoxin system YwqK family antitoxin [Candidatus Omnitrophica bacterium]|nr:toxin-antitoxin system YwqK family antitoxin [Candidatus Omnitrophota bacterium]
MNKREEMIFFILFFLVGSNTVFARMDTQNEGFGEQQAIKINIPVNMPRICGEIDDKVSGVQTQYHANGTIYQLASCLNGLRHGLYEQFYEDGSLWTTTEFVDDQIEGTKYYYYPDGTIWKELNYVQNERSGEQKFYDRKGQLMIVENYKDGKLNGKKQYFYANGNVKEERDYVAGKMEVDIKYYSEFGRELSAADISSQKLSVQEKNSSIDAAPAESRLLGDK